jgi:hypothetical protein
VGLKVGGRVGALVGGKVGGLVGKGVGQEVDPIILKHTESLRSTVDMIITPTKKINNATCCMLVLFLCFVVVEKYNEKNSNKVNYKSDKTATLSHTLSTTEIFLCHR